MFLFESDCLHKKSKCDRELRSLCRVVLSRFVGGRMCSMNYVKLLSQGVKQITLKEQNTCEQRSLHGDIVENKRDSARTEFVL